MPFCICQPFVPYKIFYGKIMNQILEWFPHRDSFSSYFCHRLSSVQAKVLWKRRLIIVEIKSASNYKLMRKKGLRQTTSDPFPFLQRNEIFLSHLNGQIQHNFRSLSYKTLTAVSTFTFHLGLCYKTFYYCTFYRCQCYKTLMTVIIHAIS